MPWTNEILAGHICDVYEPPQLKPHGWVAIYLHGVHLNRIADHEPFMRQFDKHGLRVVCPWTQRSWWTDRICQEFDPEVSAERYVLDQVVPFIADRFGTRPPQIGLFGTSMGGQGALKLAFKRPNVFPVVAALSPAIDYHLRHREGDETLTQMYPDAETARQDTATLHVHPLNWPRHMWFCCDPVDYRWHESADRLRMKLGAIGIPYECDLDTSAGGHSFTYYNHMAERAIGFLAENLERERMRVV